MMTGGGGGGLTVTGPPDPGPGRGGKNADAVWVVRVNAAAPTAAVGIILNNRAGKFMACPSAVLRGDGDCSFSSVCPLAPLHRDFPVNRVVSILRHGV
jgi:hypothetical protein